MLEVLDWEGTEEQYQQVHERLAPLGVDHIAPKRRPVEVGPVFGTTGKGVTYGRGYMVIAQGKPILVTSAKADDTLMSVFESEEV